MIKGIQKSMIWVQTPKSDCFEEAYFVVRKELGADRQRGNEMLREANRILAEHEEMKQTERDVGGRKRERWLSGDAFVDAVRMDRIGFAKYLTKKRSCAIINMIFILCFLRRAYGERDCMLVGEDFVCFLAYSVVRSHTM